jgi:CubicO group peptidase (beta-lactamase class C family)
MAAHMDFCRRARSASGRAIPLFAIFALAFLAAGCETRQESLTKSRIHKVEKGLLRAIFLKGQRPEKLSLETRMQFYKVPGAGIAVMDKNRLEWARGYGVRDSHSREPVTSDTIFQAGALSQPVAAAAALKLVDQGRLDVGDDINSRLQRLKIPTEGLGTAGKVTLREILTHAEGLPPVGLAGYAQGQKLPSLIDLFRSRESSVPAAEARSPGAGFAVLQLVLEDEARTPFSSLAEETVLGPEGMKGSTFEVPLPEAMRINAASGHGRDGRPVDGKWLNYPAVAASGLWTTPSDILSFAADILETAMGKGGKALPAALARAMLTPQSGNRGFGFTIDGSGQDVHFHVEGRTTGFTCSLVVYPYKGQGVVIMTNSENGFLLTEEILQAVSAAYEWPDWKPQERPLYRLDPSIYEQYVGRYQVTPDYVLDVTYEDYYLVIRPTGQAPTRFYVENQTFFFSIDPYVQIQFLSDDKGRVTGLVLWQQDFKQVAKRTG